MALARKHGRDSLSPGSFYRCEQTQLVIHHDVVVGGKMCLDVSKFLLFVNVNQDASLDRLVETGALHFARLENDVPIRQKGRLAPPLDVMNHVERIGKQPIGEWVPD